jgi:FkbM family methyltransferase
MKIIDSSLTSSDKVMELGTGIGFIALFCAKKIEANRVFTFEANPLLIPHIRENFRINKKEINLFNSILKHNPTQSSCEFYISKDFYSSGLTRPKYFKSVVDVSVIDFEAEINRIEPTFLIVDIEGYEYELFKELVLPAVVKKVLIELHPEKANSFSDIIGNFKVQGFAVNEQYLQLNQLYGER